MNLEFDDFDTLKNELEGLSPFHRIAFAASICERLLPNYSAFAREAEWGDPSILRVALDEVWLFLQGKPLDESKTHQLMKDCSNVAPDADNVCNSDYLPEAEVAVIAICNTLYLCVDPTPKRTIGIAERVQETLFSFVDLLLSLKDPLSWDNMTPAQQTREVANHPFTVREMAKQNEDLQRLKETDTLDREFLEWLRTASYNDGKSLIDLS